MLITGGAGFIGVNAAEHFITKGWEVTIFDNFSRKGVDLNIAFLEKSFPKKFTVIRGDVRTDSDQLKKAADTHDVILHLAAQVAVTTSVKNPREDFAINALGTFNVLEAIRLSSKKQILLYASTNKVYGGLEGQKVTEESDHYRFANLKQGVTEGEPLDFHSPYGCSKGAADQYVRDYARLYNLKTVVFRQSCIYGQHQFGIEDQGWVAWFLIAALLGRPVQIYGNGKQVRDLLHVDDLVKAYDAAIAKIELASGQIYNLGGGSSNSMSLLQFFSFLKNDLGLNVTPGFADWRPGDQPIFISDNSKAQKDLGWRPTTDVRPGIRKLFAWLQENRKDVEKFYV